MLKYQSNESFSGREKTPFPLYIYTVYSSGYNCISILEALKFKSIIKEIEFLCNSVCVL